jgi:mxaJ protein
LSANVKLQDSAGYGKLGFVIEAVASKEIDVGIVWGPIGGYYTRQQPAAFKLVPVTPEVELPFLSMVLSMTIGMRPGDEALRDRLDIALVTRWEDIQAVLNAYRVPLSPLSKPILQVGSLK